MIVYLVSELVVTNWSCFFALVPVGLYEATVAATAALPSASSSASASAAIAATSTQWDEDAKSLLQSLPEYVPLVLERVLHLLTNLDESDPTLVGGAASSSSKESGSVTRVADAPLFQTLKRFFRVFLAALAPSLFEACAKTILEAARHAPRTSTSAGYFSMALQCLVACHRESSSKVFGSLLDAWSPSLASNDQIWLLQMMGGAVREAGAALLPWLDRLTVVVLHSEQAMLPRTSTEEPIDFAVRKYGGKLVRNMLYALLHVYVVEHRPTRPEDFDASNLPALTADQLQCVRVCRHCLFCVQIVVEAVMC